MPGFILKGGVHEFASFVRYGLEIVLFLAWSAAELLYRLMSILLMGQGMCSVGSMVRGTSASYFGTAVALSLRSPVSIALTAVTFYRFLVRQF
jgi:hypothetical protein